MTEVVVSLQQALRPELKEPMGPVYTATDELLATAGEPLITVGDMVSYHLQGGGRRPDVALVDERTKRTQVDEEVTASIGGYDRTVEVTNPPATLTADLLRAIEAAVARAPATSTLIRVDGEEDLAALPAIVVAPPGAAVVYGQPNEGMVLVTVDRAAAGQARELLSRMEGDTRRLWAALNVGE